MVDDLHVIVAGLHMYGRPGLGPFAIVEDGLDGWDDAVTLRGDKAARPQAHGSLARRRYQESRTVTITGVILGKNSADREIQKNRLSGLLADGEYGRVKVSKWGLTTWAETSKDSCSIDDIRGTTKANFQLQLWCPDARRYGEERGPFVATVGENALGVRHYGNFKATPHFSIEGNMPGGYILTIKGQVFTVTRALNPGETHTINYDDGRLRVNGAIVHGGVGYGFKPLVTPGVPTVLAIAPRPPFTGTATATLSLLDTYI